MSNNDVLDLPMTVNGIVVGRVRVGTEHLVQTTTFDEENPFAMEVQKAINGPHASIDDLSIEDFAEAFAIDPKGKHAAVVSE